MKHILITGAAGAIGGALTARLGRRYPDAVFSLVDVRADALGQADYLPKRASLHEWDLADVGSLAGQFAAVEKAAGPVDLLVNCAGFMEIRNFCATDWELGERLLNVNFLAPMRLMNLAAKSMMERGHGTIVNFSSMAGRVPIRGCTYYGGGKAGMAHASEIAAIELRPRGVHVVTVYPGPVYSYLESHARAQVRQGAVSKYIPTGQPAKIASHIVKAVETGKPRVIYPRVYEVGYRLHGLAGWFTSTFSPEPLDCDPDESA